MKLSLPSELSDPVLPHLPAMPHRLDAAATLAFLTPLQEHPPAADAKAGALLTVVGLMFTLLTGTSKYLIAVVARGDFQTVILGVALAGFGILSLLTVIEAFRTISPRFPAAPPSLAFFADIARLQRDDYIQKVEAMTPDEALEQMLRYNHTLSGICVQKFGRLRKALHYCRPAFGCWLVAMILTSLRMVF